MYFNIIEDEIIACFDGQKNLETWKSWHRNTNWEIVNERRKFIQLIYPSIRVWCDGQLIPPNFVQDVFRSEDIEHLAMDYINFYRDKEYRKGLELFIELVTRCGYKDEPKLDVDGKPSSRRSTPVHHVAKRDHRIMRDVIRQIFEIYNRYDVNYTDESGLSHFHVACMKGLDDEIKKFLELGQDPNCLWPETGDSPLHLYLIGGRSGMAEALMRSSANLNLANKEGLTALHIISKEYYYDISRTRPYPNEAKLLFDISDELNQTLQVNARDKFGNTPLHLAVLNYNDYVIELLLRRGADPNSANDEGSTTLHEFYKRHNFVCNVERSMEPFFKICDEVNQSVHIDAKDKLGRTPLQLAVANFWPDCIDILFERGADLSSFVFPNDYFAEIDKSLESDMSYFRLRLAFGALAVVEKIEKRGYELKRSEALTIMKFFAKYRLFEKSSDLEKCWYDDKNFTIAAKKIQICPGLSLDEVVRLRPEEAAKLLTYEDYWKFSLSGLQCWEFREYKELSELHLFEKVSRGFFRSWALDLFMELIHGRLPILCCEMIIEHLSNEDLYNICLAAADQSS